MKPLFCIVIATILAITLQSEFIKYEEEGQISILTINRPKALNALNSQVLEELNKTLDIIDTSKTRVLIITGAGEKSFVAGADISEMSTLSKKFGEEFSKKGNDVFRRIETFQIPVIAAINGFALGGGCEISMSCDIRICSDNAIFGQPEVGLGITPGFGGTQRLARLVGMGMAKQMIFTGQNIKAEEALRIGLVNAIYPQNELLNEAKKLALAIAKNYPQAVQRSKKAINEGVQVDIDKGVEIEEKLFGDCFETSEQIEGMNNFLSKGKKGKKEEKKEAKNEAKKEKNLQAEIEMPKGELVPTDKFKNMVFLKEFTTPQMPAILSAGDKNSYNSMAIEWGSIGVSWKMPIFTVYVKDERYTYEFMQKTEIFTVSIIAKKMYKKFAVYGTKSGRDINKEEVAGTHIKFLDDGGITFDEAIEVFVCRMLGKAYIQDEDSYPGLKAFYKKQQKYFKNLKPHAMFIGEIIGHYVRKE